MAPTFAFGLEFKVDIKLGAKNKVATPGLEKIRFFTCSVEIEDNEPEKRFNIAALNKKQATAYFLNTLMIVYKKTDNNKITPFAVIIEQKMVDGTQNISGDTLPYRYETSVNTYKEVLSVSCKPEVIETPGLEE